MQRIPEAILTAAAILVLGAAAASALPEGVGYHDSGDIQMAAVTLGIAHPPGYPLIALAGFPFTRLIPDDPAFGMTILNWLCGLVVLFMTLLVLRRLGVRTPVAVAASLGFGVWSVFWELWTIPEVYVPALLFFIVVVYGFIRWEHSGRPAMIVIAAFAMGCYVFTRVNAAASLPFAVAAVVFADFRRRRFTQRSPARVMVCALLGLSIPVLMGLCYLWLRDTPHHPYNYVAQWNASTHGFPLHDYGTEAKLRRLAWLVIARQYWDHLDSEPADIVGRLKRRIEESTPVGLLLFFMLTFTSAAAVGHLYRRRAATLVLLLGWCFAEGAFLAANIATDVATMALPLVWCLTVLAACGVERLGRAVQHVRVRRGRIDRFAFGRYALAVVLAVVVIVTSQRVFSEPPAQKWFTEEVDWSALPPRAVIGTPWHYYANLKDLQLRHRPDVRVVSPPRGYESRLAALTDDPVYFFAEATTPGHGWIVRPEHGLYRVTQSDD